MKIISWNVNGIRSAAGKGFAGFVNKYRPDILCLQETKALRGQAEIDLPDYEEYWNSAEKKGYSGTAIFTKLKPENIKNDLPGLKNLIDNQGRDALKEGRIITAEFKKFFLVTVYTPNAKDDLSRLDFKHKKWDPLFLKHLKKLGKKKPVIFCGDLNVAYEKIDLARPEQNEGNKGFTKEERQGFDKIMQAGFIDTLRDKYPDKAGLYTWWSHWADSRKRNIGWRLDYFCVSKTIKKCVKDAFILPEVTGSDHCPVGIEILI